MSETFPKDVTPSGRVEIFTAKILAALAIRNGGSIQIEANEVYEAGHYQMLFEFDKENRIFTCTVAKK